MKIRPDMIDGVRQDQQDKTNRIRKPGTDFGDILNKEMQGPEQAQKSQATAPPIMNPLFGVGQAAPVSSVSAVDQTAARQVDGLVDQMERYAATLGDPSASLKDAYGELEQLSQGVDRIREQLPDLGEKAPGLSAVVDEMDALAATEQFKFNRGDYQ
ncbi:hypothetical protein [Desulfovibrio oxyclinae]|jgi:hypothetical protein|uniref:hypothetical protein n=1 Tax=Desulfovibrio oxyclinae TaxID=63560 RepID=UPI0003780D86|nr:hypothetical protein [Desulfovibrio oxyclinae]